MNVTVSCADASPENERTPEKAPVVAGVAAITPAAPPPVAAAAGLGSTDPRNGIEYGPEVVPSDQLIVNE